MTRLTGRHIFLLAALGFIAYAPALRTGFIFDDHLLIEANPYIRSWTLPYLKHDFSSDLFFHQGQPYYRPLQTLSHRVEYSFYKARPFGYHLTSLLFHIGNAILLCELILLLGFNLPTALLTASLFVVHPIIVSEIMMIAGRSELMSFFFSLACLILLAGGGTARSVLGIVAYGLSLFSKESAVVTPLLLGLIYIYKNYPLRRFWIFLPLGLLTGFFFYLRSTAVSQIFPPLDPALAVRFLFRGVPYVLFRYAALIVWPWGLHSERIVPPLNPFWWVYLVGAIALPIFFWKRNNRMALFCFSWFMVCLLAKIVAMLSDFLMLEHWIYPAMLGILLPLGWVLAKGGVSPKSPIRWGAWAVFCGSVIFYTVLVHVNVAQRGSDEKMYRWSLRYPVPDWIGLNLGVFLLQHQRPAEAIPYLENYRGLHPDDFKATNALALANWNTGQKSRARQLLEDARRKNPQDETTRHNLDLMKKQPAPEFIPVKTAWETLP